MNAAWKVLGVFFPIALGVGCSSGTEPDPEPDPRLCQQTYEFGNYGCAEIRGTVRTLGGSGLERVWVGPKYADGQDCCPDHWVRTGADGTYTFRVVWMWPTFSPMDHRPDTLSLYVKATFPSGGHTDPIYSDSAFVTVRFADVGQMAPIRWVDFHLPVPQEAG